MRVAFHYVTCGLYLVGCTLKGQQQTGRSAGQQLRAVRGNQGEGFHTAPFYPEEHSGNSGRYRYFIDQAEFLIFTEFLKVPHQPWWLMVQPRFQQLLVYWWKIEFYDLLTKPLRSLWSQTPAPIVARTTRLLSSFTVLWFFSRWFSLCLPSSYPYGFHFC